MYIYIYWVISSHFLDLDFWFGEKGLTLILIQKTKTTPKTPPTRTYQIERNFKPETISLAITHKELIIIHLDIFSYTICYIEPHTCVNCEGVYVLLV